MTQTERGVKVVRVEKGKNFSATPYGTVTEFPFGVKVEQPPDGGPYAVFDDMEYAESFAKELVKDGVLTENEVRIFPCGYEPSNEAFLWKRDPNSLHIIKDRSLSNCPNGTRFASSVILYPR
jgi:hypothetical protein